MRLFIGVPLPDNMRNIAEKLSEKLDPKRFRFVKPENFDLTLAFLGERDDVDEIREKLRKIQFSKISLKTNSFGFFPSNNRIRVVWIGLEKNEEFYKLQKDIRVLFYFKDKFMPHITVARARQLLIDKNNEFEKILGKVQYEEISFEVDKFILFKSELKPEGPIHTVLEEYYAI